MAVPEEMSYMPRLTLSESIPAIGYLISLREPVLVVMSRRGKDVTSDSSLR